MAKEIIKISRELLKCLNDAFESDSDVRVVSLCTSDGFNLKSYSSLDTEIDKIAALASTFCAMSKSTAEQLMNSHHQLTIVETQNGNAIFTHTSYANKDCVLSLVTNQGLSLAKARFLANRMADFIRQL